MLIGIGIGILVALLLIDVGIFLNLATFIMTAMILLKLMPKPKLPKLAGSNPSKEGCTCGVQHGRHKSDCPLAKNYKKRGKNK